MLELQRNPWPARLAFPTPEQLEALAVPMDEGSRRHDGQSAAPIETAAEPQQGQARRLGGPAGLDSALLVDGELLAQEEILRCKRAPGTQTEDQKAEQIAKQVQPEQTGFYHGPISLVVALLPSNSSRLRPFQVTPLIFAEHRIRLRFRSRRRSLRG